MCTGTLRNGSFTETLTKQVVNHIYSTLKDEDEMNLNGVNTNLNGRFHIHPLTSLTISTCLTGPVI